MPNANDLLVRIDATTEALRRELKKGDTAVGDFQSNVNRRLSGIDASFAGMGKGVGVLTSGFGTLRTALGAVGIAVGLVGLKRLVIDSLDAAGNIGEVAQQLGVTTQTLQTLTYAGTQFGVSQGEIELSLAKLSKTIGEAAEGGKNAIDAFTRLGVKILDAGGKVRSTDAIFREVIQAISAIEDPARRAATGADVMGKGFQKLLPIANDGAAGFDAVRKEAEALGLIFSQDLIKNADEASDKLATLAAVLSAQLTQTLVILAPLLTAAAQGLLDLVTAFNAAADPSGLPNLTKQLNAFDESIRVLEENQSAYESNAAGRWLNNLWGAKESNEKRIAELKVERARVLAEIMGNTDGVPAALIPVVPGVSNPPPKPSGGKSEAEKEADKLKAALQGVRDKLAALDADLAGDARGKLMAENFRAAGVAVDELNPKYAELVMLTDMQFEKARELEIGTLALAAAHEADAEASAEYNKILDQAKGIYEALRTPMERYNATIAEATLLRDGDMISQETFNRQVDAAGDAFIAADEHAQKLISTASQVGSGFVSAFAKIGTSIKTTKDLLREMVGVLATAVSNAAGGGITSILTNLLKGGLTAGTGGGAPGSNPASFGMAEGGIMTARGRVALRRYSGGGVANFPQIAVHGDRPGGRAEAYVPLPDGRSIPVTMKGGGEGGGMSVSVVNNISVEGGKDGASTGAKVGEAVTVAMESFFDERLTYHLRDRGMLRPNTV